MGKLWKSVLLLVLVLYLIVLTKEILFKYLYILDDLQWELSQPGWRSSNFVPFKTIYFYLFLADVNPSIIIQNLVGNVIGFMPLGFLLPLISSKRFGFGTVFITSLLLSLTYEVLQLYTALGSFDVDDLILNTFGALLGFVLVKMVLFVGRKLFP